MSDKKHHAEEAAIRKLDAEWSKAAQDKDIDASSPFMRPTARWSGPGDPAARGQAAIRAALGGGLQVDAQPLSAVRADSHRDLQQRRHGVGFRRGVFRAKASDANDRDNVGKYLVVWQRQHGAWKVLYDCYNMNGTNNPVNQ